MQLDKCPIRPSLAVGGMATCRNDCMWYDKHREMCRVASISESLYSIEDRLGELRDSL
jgi:hypothetical protein